MRCDVVIFDPLYKLVDGDENAARDMKPILADFDRLANDTGAAIIYSHHDAKGVPGDRGIRDRGAGSNVIGRDYDTGITLTRHRSETDAVVVEFLCRNYVSPATVVVRFDGIGAMTLAPELPTEVETSNTARNSSARGDRWEQHVEAAIELALSRVWFKGDFERELKRTFRLSGVQSAALYKSVRDDARVFTKRGPNHGDSPRHFIGPEDDVEAEIERMKRNATERRQPWLPKNEDTDENSPARY